VGNTQNAAVCGLKKVKNNRFFMTMPIWFSDELEINHNEELDNG
jgi:hypothetical protein